MFSLEADELGAVGFVDHRAAVDRRCRIVAATEHEIAGGRGGDHYHSEHEQRRGTLPERRGVRKRFQTSGVVPIIGCALGHRFTLTYARRTQRELWDAW